MAWTWYNSRLVKNKDLTENVKHIQLQMETNDFEFKAGQFITMDLPIHEKRLKRWRSYSIATSPHEFSNNILDFIIAGVPDGLATKYFWEEMELGANIKFKGPAGVFHLPKVELENDIVFICTGTGIVPCLSMMNQLHQSGRKYKNIHLIFGTRWLKNIFVNSWLKKVEEEFPNMQCTVALSREERHINPHPFEITYGYVQHSIEENYKSPRENVDFYICGWQAMVDDVSKNLKAYGYRENQIHVELYG